MKIYCDYCGTQIDTDKCPRCPACGAPYADDEELRTEQRAEQKREENKILMSDIDARINALKAQEDLKEMNKLRADRDLRKIGKFIVAAISLGLALYVLIKIGSILPDFRRIYETAASAVCMM